MVQYGNGGAGDDFLSGSNDPGITDNLNGGAGNDTIVVNNLPVTQKIQKLS